MAGALFVMPYPEFDDVAGRPLSGGSLAFTDEFDTEAHIHADQAGRVSLGSVVRLNGAGRLQSDGGAPVSLWVDPTSPYDVVVSDEDGDPVRTVTGYRQPAPGLVTLQVLSYVDSSSTLTRVHALHKLARTDAAMLAFLFEPSASEEGIVVHIQAATAFAHVVFLTGGLAGAGSGNDTATFGGAIGDGMTLIAADGVWHLVSSLNVVFS